MARCEQRGSTDRAGRPPVPRSESPTGYSSAGCSPAEPASASPVSEQNNLDSTPARSRIRQPVPRVSQPGGAGSRNKRRKLSPMSPVQNVTYDPGRSDR
jgi:hypothetical protein